MDDQERMDAMAPEESSPRRPNAALQLLVTSLRAQVELGLEIEAAHSEEVRDHLFTKRRLNTVWQDRERVMRDLAGIRDRLDRVREAIAGNHITDAVPTKDGDILAEARELFAKCYNMESELYAARTLLEKVPDGPDPNWEKARDDWYKRVSSRLDLTNPEIEREAAGESHS